ncbi:hypothetical protein Syun_016845 [Stephania yunnanensis]|uniref:PHD finger protein ALFIN-LIKE n=1 Tax=Stephania yunnanensis TaxID=152371 RepID=A0AAP0P2I5_9MAGN
MGSRPSVDQVFRDYCARREGIIRALTTDVEQFFALCDPKKEECLCLYGHPDGRWEVKVPPPELPPELSDPVLGINFERDEMPRDRWLMMVACHSHSWLIAVAFYFGFHFNRKEREHLFTLINDLPTVFDVLAETLPAVDAVLAQNLGCELDGGNESSIQRTSNEQVRRTSDEQVMRRTSDEPVRGTGDEQVMRRTIDRLKRTSDEKAKSISKKPDKATGEDDKVHDACGSCSGKYAEKFWVMCDMCKNWYHCKCVQITPSKSKTIGKYICPSCRGRQ